MLTFSGSLLELLPIFLRSFGFVLLLPLEAGVMGLALKFLLSLATSFYLQDPGGTAQATDLAALGAEFFWGVLLGMPLALLLESAASLGELFDVARGQNISDMIDPLNQHANSRSGILSGSYIWVVLLWGGVAERSLAHLRTGWDVFSPDCSNIFSRALAAYILKLDLIFFAGALRCFLPLALLFCTIEIALLSVQRALPNFFGQGEAMIIKSALGIGTLIIWLGHGQGLGWISAFDWFNPNAANLGG